MITFEESILMTVILRNTRQELSLEQTPPHPRRNPSTLLTVCSTVMGRSVFQICLRSKREFFLNAMMHPGIHRTLVLISTQFYWPKMHPDIHSYVTNVTNVRLTKPSDLKPLDFYILWIFPIISGKVYPWILLLAFLAPKKPMMPSGWWLID